jgi:hypothetical protein
METKDHPPELGGNLGTSAHPPELECEDKQKKPIHPRLCLNKDFQIGPRSPPAVPKEGFSNWAPPDWAAPVTALKSPHPQQLHAWQQQSAEKEHDAFGITGTAHTHTWLNPKC